MINTKPVTAIHRALLSGAVCLLIITGACENPQVQQLLYGPSELENLTVQADDLNIYDMSPYFTRSLLRYDVTVPYGTLQLRVAGRPVLDGKVYYRIGDGVSFGPENTSGVLPFPLDMEDAFVKVRVLRPGMEERTYTIFIKRGADSLLGGIKVQSAASSGNVATAAVNIISPGFDPERFDYSVRVRVDAQYLLVTGFVAPSKAEVEYKEGVAGSYAPAPGGFLVNFSGVDTTDVYLQVTGIDKATSLPDPATTVVYKLTVNRNNKVWLDPATLASYPNIEFEMEGGAALPTDPNNARAYGPGDPVAFTLAPPFGYKLNTLTRTTAGQTPVSMEARSNNRYFFIMPTANVTIAATFTPIPAATYTNVRYVYEKGDRTNPSNDGTSWAKATSDLQRLIDEYTGVSPYDYEIWIAKGTLTPPNFSTELSAAATGPGGWANGSLSNLTAVQKENPLYWAFVLKTGIKIYGGFKGTEVTEADKESRDTAANETILSGTVGERKTFRVMIAPGVSYAHVEGLTLYGPYNVLNHTTFTVNGKTITTQRGAVLYAVDSNPVFKKVKFRYGQTSNATGVAIFGNSCPVFLHCEFDHSQSAQLGSALGLVYGAPYTSGSPSVVVIGGTFFLNWDAGGVINVERGRSTLVNVSIRDNLEHAIFSGGTDDVFINLTVTGNRGALTDSQYTVKGNATLYNSVIKGNLTTGIAANVDTAATIYNTIATDHPSTIPDGSYLDRGDDDYYPLETNGAWNHGSPGYNNLTYSLGAADGTDLENLTGDAAVLAEAIREALALDSTGTRPRFRGGHIDLGAEEN